MKDLISLNINNLYILHCNDPLIPKWGSMWFNRISRWRNPILLLETILVPTHWASIILIKNSNMSCIYLLSPTHCLYMVRILKIDPCVHVKYEMWMKLVKNELFIEKKLGQNGCWNLILPLENNIGRWIEIWAKSDHWIIT